MTLKHLTSRDHTLLVQLDVFGWLTSQQIKHRFFGQTQIRTVLRRLRTLERRRLIQRSTGLRNGINAWSLTSLGLKAIGSTNPALKVNKNSLGHDVVFNSIRLKMEHEGVGGAWRNGHALKQGVSKNRSIDRERAIIPDGLLVLNGSETPMAIAIELELHTKSKRRYRKIFELYSQKKIQMLWYWVPNERLGTTLLEEWARVGLRGQQITFAWSLVDECLGEIKKLKLRTKDGVHWFGEFHPAHSAGHLVSRLADDKKMVPAAKSLKPNGILEAEKHPPLFSEVDPLGSRGGIQ